MPFLVGICPHNVLAQTATVTGNWMQQSPATSPRARYQSTMAYDAATGTVVLFGGLGSSGTALADTWTYSGTTWTQQSPATSPPARYGSVMAYDAATGTVVLFGGISSSGSVVADTWTYNGTTWTQQSQGTSPPAREGSTMAYDAATGTVVLFGGSGNNGYLSDTWTYNGTTWTQQSPASSPPARDGATMAYDAATGTVVLFGGYIYGSNISDTWTYNGTTWTQQSPGTSPPARNASAMAYDAATGNVVLFGGISSSGSYLSDTWTYNGTTWTQQSPASSPPARYGSTTAYDAATGTVVLFGGSNGNSNLADTWTYAAGAFVAPTTNVGATAAEQTPVYFNITATGRVGTPQVLTQGASGLDFALGSTATTCTGSATGVCTVYVAFTPQAPGLRMGAVNLTNSTGTVIATAYITGTGTGPLVGFTPGTISTVAGNTTQCTTSATTGCADGGAATSAQLAAPYASAVDSLGNLYIADTYDQRIRKVTAATGIITTVAGNGTQCASTTAACGDTGAAASAQLAYPNGVAVDGAGNLYIADSNDNRIRKVTLSTSIITTVAGTGTQCSSTTATCGDNASATASNLYGPRDVALDGAGNLYITDGGDNRVREVIAATGIITTVAGSGTACASPTAPCGDDGLATASGANFNTPFGVALDGAGNLYIGDLKDNRVRKITAATGIITTVAGTGSQCSSPTASCGDNAAAADAQLNGPQSVAVDAGGNLYITDVTDQRIRKVTAATSFISTVAGNGNACFASPTASCGDGAAATSASFAFLNGVTVDGAGNLYIADNANNLIRKVTASTPPLLFANTPVGSSSASQTVTVNNIGNAALTYPIPGTGQNPSQSNFFTLGNTSTCITLTNASSNPVSLAGGASCTEVISFAPTLSGSVTGNLIFTDNNLNTANATQTAVETGSTTSALTVSVVSQSVRQGTSSVTLEFTVGYGANTAPTATPTLTVNGSSTNVGAIACTIKTGHNNCTATYNPSSLAPTLYTITATQPADTTYTTPTSANGSLTITRTSSGPIRIGPIATNPITLDPVTASSAARIH